MPRLHDQQTGFVVRLIGVHGTDDTQIIGTLGKLGKQLTHHHAAIAVRGKLEGR